MKFYRFFPSVRINKKKNDAEGGKDRDIDPDLFVVINSLTPVSRLKPRIFEALSCKVMT